MANILENIATLQESGVAYLQNAAPMIDLANKQFQNFQNFEGNLGTSVKFTRPYRFRGQNSLVVGTFEDIEQRTLTLTVDQEFAVPVAASVQERIYNVEKYMDEIGKGAVMNLGSAVEQQISQNMLNYTYRFFGDGTTPLDSFDQLAQSISDYKDFGAPGAAELCYVLPITRIPAIIGSGLNQFVPNRNDRIAMSWDLGAWAGASWYTSNQLPTHTAGTVGQNGSTLTVVSINAAGDQIVCSGAGAGETVLVNDLIQFDDGVVGFPNVRAVTFTGHNTSDQRLQARITADATEAAGSITLNVDPPLLGPSSASANQRSSEDIVAGMQISVMPSHKVGYLFYKKAFYLGMPRLPNEAPFPSSNLVDETTGAAMRLYYGSIFGQNSRGFVHDTIWGSAADSDYWMRILLPL